MKDFYLLSYRGKISIDYPAWGNPYKSPPASERRDTYGAGTVYGRTMTYPLRFHAYGTRKIYVFRDAHANASKIYDRREIRTRVLEGVECKGVTSTELKG